MLEVLESVLKTAACSEGHMEMEQVGAGLSGGEGQLGKGKVSWGRGRQHEAGTTMMKLQT